MRNVDLSEKDFRRIVEESHADADRRLAEHRDRLDALAQALLKAESLNEKEIRGVTGMPKPVSQQDTDDADEAMMIISTDDDVESWENEGGQVGRSHEGTSAWGEDEGPWEG